MSVRASRRTLNAPGFDAVSFPGEISMSGVVLFVGGAVVSFVGVVTVLIDTPGVVVDGVAVVVVATGHDTSKLSSKLLGQFVHS